MPEEEWIARCSATDTEAIVESETFEGLKIW